MGAVEAGIDKGRVELRPGRQPEASALAIAAETAFGHRNEARCGHLHRRKQGGHVAVEEGARKDHRGLAVGRADDDVFHPALPV